MLSSASKGFGGTRLSPVFLCKPCAWVFTIQYSIMYLHTMLRTIITEEENNKYANEQIGELISRLRTCAYVMKRNWERYIYHFLFYQFPGWEWTSRQSAWLKAGSYFAAGRGPQAAPSWTYFNFLCISTNSATEFPAISLACCVCMNINAIAR